MKILVVEDEKKVASFIKRGLEEEFFTVDTVNDGRSGTELALSGQYDLLIFDIMLPFRDGLAITRMVRENKISTPILLLSAKDKVVDKVEGLDAGADDYLTKPFAFEELIARVRALVRRRESEKSVLLIFRELQLDTQSHRLKHLKREIELTPKEFSILEYLLRNKGRIVSRTLLTQHIYEYNFDTDTNVIDVYINKLRSKILSLVEYEVIHTVRGVGYTVNDDE